MAQKLNNKLNYQPRDDQEEEEEATEESHHKYEEELEINDFPQQARYTKLRFLSSVLNIFLYNCFAHFIFNSLGLFDVCLVK